jgi:exodeoxyribonuclease VII large subunit
MSQPELDFSDLGTAQTRSSGPGAPDDPQPEGTFTVSQLAELINTRLRAGYDDGVWVRGEIQGWSARGPHAYFTLADDQSESKAVIQVAFFAPQRERLRRLLERHHLVLGDGMKVRIHGYLDFYAPNGRLTLKMGGIDPRFTLGDLAQQRDQVLRRLVAGGHIDRNKRHRLSPVPLRIGVVTSIGSAAWHDFENELKASAIGFRLSVCDVRVQGDHAVAMVAGGIELLARRPLDAVVVIRGGGARNELAVFDAEPIAMAIAGATVPVLTGLGHEVDRSVADEVAHSSFKTPTACAQYLVQVIRQYLGDAEQAYAKAVDLARVRLDGAEQRLADRTHRIARRTHGAVGRADEGIGQRIGMLRRSTARQLGSAARRLEAASSQLRARSRQALAGEQRHVEALAGRARSLDPVAMLARGWTITRRADGALLRSSTAVAAGDVIDTLFADGHLLSTAHGPPNEER